MKQMSLSSRGFHRILKVARTIADPSAALRAGLADADSIGIAHPAEALQYRPAGWV